MNWVDRLIAVFSPQRAARNVVARHAVRQSERLLGSRRRYAESSAFGVNTGRVEDALPRSVVSKQRIRRLLATNPYAAKVRATLLNNLIGFGITGVPKKGSPKRVAEAWKLWVKNSDWLGRLDFYGQQDQSVGSMIGDGEVFIVRRFTRSKPGIVPLRLQLLDASMLYPGPSGKSIDYDADGRPTRYHFRPARLLEDGQALGNPVSFDADDVIHLFRQDWPGQTRGSSIFEPAMKRFEDMDDYIEAEVVRKKIEACFAAFITPSAEYAAENADLGRETEEQTEAGFEVEVFEPGMIERLRPGDDIKFGDPKPSAAIAEFARVTLLGATTGAGVPYEHGTGDLSNVNYSSYRAGSLEFQRFCGRLQWLLIIPVMLERVWDWFLQDGYESGILQKRYYDIGWTPPAFESIDRGKDVAADIAEMGAGLASRRSLIAARGDDHDEVLAEISADWKTQQGLELSFAGDPGSAIGQNFAAGAPQQQKGKQGDGDD